MPNLDALRKTQSSRVLTPDDEGYADAARTWGPPSSPDVIVRPTTPAEVGAALTWAATEGVEVGIRSGSHGAWTVKPGGLSVDLGAFARVDVDGDVVRIGPGATWGAVAEALDPHGLALSSGDTRTVGVGGNTLGAGIGWLVRSVGLAADQLVAAEIVTADGRVVVASEQDNPELFFAIRGGGGNFGVATRLDFRAHPLGDVVFATAPIDRDRFATALTGIRDALRAAPRELGVTVIQPPPVVPDPAPMVEMLWAGDDEDTARAGFAPLLAAEGVGEADVRVVPYASTLVDPPAAPGGGPPPRMTSSNGVFADLSDATIERAVATLTKNPSTMLEVRFLGGAFSDVPADATALAWRDAEALVHWISFLPPDASPGDLAAAAAAWAPVGDGASGFCGTFTDETGPELIERMYPPATLDRLRAVKREWDQGNLFRRNHTITP